MESSHRRQAWLTHRLFFVEPWFDQEIVVTGDPNDWIMTMLICREFKRDQPVVLNAYPVIPVMNTRSMGATIAELVRRRDLPVRNALVSRWGGRGWRGLRWAEDARPAVWCNPGGETSMSLWRLSREALRNPDD